MNKQFTKLLQEGVSIAARSVKMTDRKVEVSVLRQIVNEQEERLKRCLAGLKQ